MAESNLEKIKRLQSEKPDNRQKAVGYVRVSTREQSLHGFSLKSQEDNIKDYCLRNNMNLLKIYRDEGISGSVYERPGLQDLLKELKKETVVLCWELDRLSRDLGHVCKIKDEVHKVQGCYLSVINRNLSTKSDTDNLLLNILAVFSQNEREVIRNRISTTMQNMSKTGSLRKKPRYGWKYGENNTLEEIEEEQLIIKEVLRMFHEEKLNTSQIACLLNEQGIKLRKSKKIFPQTILRIVKNNQNMT